MKRKINKQSYFGCTQNRRIKTYYVRTKRYIDIQYIAKYISLMARTACTTQNIESVRNNGHLHVRLMFDPGKFNKIDQHRSKAHLELCKIEK